MNPIFILHNNLMLKDERTDYEEVMYRQMCATVTRQLRLSELITLSEIANVQRANQVKGGVPSQNIADEESGEDDSSSTV